MVGIVGKIRLSWYLRTLKLFVLYALNTTLRWLVNDIILKLAHLIQDQAQPKYLGLLVDSNITKEILCIVLFIVKKNRTKLQKLINIYLLVKEEIKFAP